MNRDTELARGGLPPLDRATIHPFVDATPGPFFYQRIGAPRRRRGRAAARRARRRSRAPVLLGHGRDDRAPAGHAQTRVDGSRRRRRLLRHRRPDARAVPLGARGRGVRPDRRAAGGRPGVVRAVLEPDADVPGSRRRDRTGARGRGGGRRRQHRAQPGAAAPARATARISSCTAGRRSSPATTTRCSASSPARVAEDHARLQAFRTVVGNRRRARPGVADAARDEDARAPGRRASPPPRSSWRAGSRPTRASSASAIRGSAIRSRPATSTRSGRCLSFDVADADSAARVERSPRS